MNNEEKIITVIDRFTRCAELALRESQYNRAIFECSNCHGKAIIVKDPKTEKFTPSCHKCEIKVMN